MSEFLCHVDVRVLNKIAQNWRIVLLTPESWLFVSINSLTDSVLLQLTMKRPDKNFTVRHIFSLRLNEHQYQFIKLMARFALSLPAMRLSCERTNHWVAHGSPVNLAKLTNLLVAQAVTVHIWIFAHSWCRSVTLFGDWLVHVWVSKKELRFASRLSVVWPSVNWNYW